MLPSWVTRYADFIRSYHIQHLKAHFLVTQLILTVEIIPAYGEHLPSSVNIDQPISCLHLLSRKGSVNHAKQKTGLCCGKVVFLYILIKSWLFFVFPKFSFGKVMDWLWETLPANSVHWENGIPLITDMYMVRMWFG